MIRARAKISRLLLAATLVLSIGAHITQAQTPDLDTLKVNYFAGANGARPDQTVRITNPGTAVDPTGSTTSDLCANIYVFRADQQLAECCSCKVTPNGLRTLSVDFDLTHNPLTSGAIGEGVIKIVSSGIPRGASCTPAFAGSAYAPVPALRAWGTHNQDVSGSLGASAASGQNVGYGPTDFIIAQSGGPLEPGLIGVYDQNLVFKSYLDNNFPRVRGLDFLSNGNLVAVGWNGPASTPLKQYSPSGTVVSSFPPSSSAFSDVKVSSANLLYVSTDSGVAEFTL